MISIISFAWLLLFDRVDAWSTETTSNVMQLSSQRPFQRPTHLATQAAESHANQFPLGRTRSSLLLSPNDMDPEALLEYLNDDRVLASSFQDFQKEKLLKDYIKACPVFTDVSDADCTRLASRMVEMDVEPGQVLIEMGTVDQAGMYFVKEGSFDCRGENNTLLTTYDQPGSYFGELSLVFSGQPRAATIVATGESPAKVFRLDKKTFQESLRESPDTAALFDAARQMLLKKYSTTRLRDVIPEVRLDEVAGLLQAKILMGSNQRTYKKLFSFTMGAAAAILVSFWRPQVKAATLGNWPQILDLSAAVSSKSTGLLPLKMVSSLLTVTSIFGVLAQTGGNNALAVSRDETADEKDLESSRPSRPTIRRIANVVGAVVNAGLWAAGPNPRRILLQTLTCLILKQVNFVDTTQPHGGTTQLHIFPVSMSLLLVYEATRLFLRPMLL